MLASAERSSVAIVCSGGSLVLQCKYVPDRDNWHIIKEKYGAHEEAQGKESKSND